MVYETRKILGDQSIQVCPTCIRIPVSNCHSETINVETERPLTVEEATRLFASFPGITVVDDPTNGQYPMPSTCDGSDAVFIGEFEKTCPTRMRSRSGACPTTFAKGQRRTPCRSLNFWQNIEQGHRRPEIPEKLTKAW